MAVITISRGSAGVAAALADRLAKLLECRVLSREEVYDRARSYGIHETGLGDLELLDQKPPSLWYPFQDRRQRYLACFEAALMDAAVSGDLVYVGHLAHLLLASYRRVLRVRVAAPERYRVEMLVRERGMSTAQARSYIREVDERRLRWSQFLYGLDWRNAELYDLVLNPDKLGLETMAEVVAAIAQSPEMQPTPHDCQQLADQRLVAVSRAALLRFPRTRGLDVTIDADAQSGQLRVYGVGPSMSLESAEDDLRVILGKIPGVISVEVTLRDDPFR